MDADFMQPMSAQPVPALPPMTSTLPTTAAITAMKPRADPPRTDYAEDHSGTLKPIVAKIDNMVLEAGSMKAKLSNQATLLRGEINEVSEQV
jgi:hypothetical protein